MPILLQLQEIPWKGDGGWEKSVFSCVFFFFFFFLLTSTEFEFRRRNWKCVLGHLTARATSYYLLPDTLWLQASKNAFEVGSVKFSSSLSPPSIVKYASEVKAAKGLKRCRAKVKEVNNPGWIAQYHRATKWRTGQPRGEPGEWNPKP